MDKRIALFLVLAFAIVLGNALLTRWLQGPPQVAQEEAGPAQAPAPDKAEKADAGKVAPAAGPPVAEAQAAPAAEAEAPAEPEVAPPAPKDSIPEQRVTLGSADPKSPYRMLLTIVNRGAALERIELNNPQYLDQEDRCGYLAHLASTDDSGGRGAVVGVVGPGTPAAVAGLLAGDIITQVDATEIDTAQALEDFMKKTEPDQQLAIHVVRGDQALELKATLARRPLEVIRPGDLAEVVRKWEHLSPDVVRPVGNTPSLLMTLDEIDDRKLDPDAPELAGLELRRGNWELLPAATATEVAFRQMAGDTGLEVIKRYRLAKDKEGDAKNVAEPAYHLVFELEIRNSGNKPHKIAYRLDGPNGLPTEGWWYASKISRNWGGVGPRDVVVGWQQGNYIDPKIVGCLTIASPEPIDPWRGTPLRYIGVDAQYFSAVLIPQKHDPQEMWFAESQPVIVGDIPEEKDKRKLANTSFRLTSETVELAPGAAPLVHSYTLFAGPKKPEILESYDLGDLTYYGWFGWVSSPMLHVLHAFRTVFLGNAGLAIILLTVLVRSCMVPLSRKQAMSAQKMQELQPELRKLQEKYKNNLEGRNKAQRELFSKHNYNPLGGCLLMFIQLPIFIGLYRSLSADVDLRQAPLISEAFRWASNLAAPDMLFRWDQFLPEFALGWLGPFFNVLPLFTIALFIWQQKMFMPPPADEQAAMQQKMMQYMMIFMGVMFFKVPSGLCIYFIASSLWGVAERKLLPKPGAAPTAKAPESRPVAVAGVATGNGSAGAGGAKKKQRGK